MQRNWAIWMRAVTVAAAVTAILASALAMPPEIDHRNLTAQPAVASTAGGGVIVDRAAQPGPDRNCHSGHSCILVNLPTNDLALTRFDSAPEISRETGFLSSAAENMLFHPPRILSQV